MNTIAPTYNPYPDLDKDIDFELAIKNLPEKEKTMVRMLRDGYTHQEIANKIGVERSVLTRKIQNVHKKYTIYGTFFVYLSRGYASNKEEKTK